MYYVRNQELYHHGVLGMKWGIRRYQPYRNGEKKGKEIGEAAKAERRAARKESLKRGAKVVAKGAGAVVKMSAKVLAKTAVTSAVLAGLGAAGVVAINDPRVQRALATTISKVQLYVDRKQHSKNVSDMFGSDIGNAYETGAEFLDKTFGEKILTEELLRR